MRKFASDWSVPDQSKLDQKKWASESDSGPSVTFRKVRSKPGKILKYANRLSIQSTAVGTVTPKAAITEPATAAPEPASEASKKAVATSFLLNEKRDASTVHKHGRNESTESDVMSEFCIACEQHCAGLTEHDEKREFSKAHKHGHVAFRESDEKREFLKAYKHGHAKFRESDEKRESSKAHKHRHAKFRESDEKRESSKAPTQAGATSKTASSESAEKVIGKWR
ncbi:unnamed protein product [Rotaria magnacalcarata]|uniref:Uncharacterized protein n=2 Tax=Rotaria magnacalcarata TaxID=392030 RepID=A0A8S2PXS3_9BILA|nr:unnamed protein product [Rotaria magnacalcarata]